MPANAEGTGNGDGTGMATPTELQIEQARQDAEREAAEEALSELAQVESAIIAAANEQGFGDKIALTFDGRGLVLSLLNEAVLFDSGQATLRPEGFAVLQTVVPALRNIPNDILVEGHTDNVPVRNSRFASNWELSVDRATSVLDYLVGQGIPGTKIKPSGGGEYYPIADNSTPEGRATNRRVEIVILSEISLDAALVIDG
jgi:chemotaxis protein MotB